MPVPQLPGDVLWGLALVTSLVVYQLAPWVLVSLLGLAAFAGLAFFRLELGLAGVMLVAPFYLQVRWFGPLFFSPVEVLILLCLALWILRWVTGRQTVHLGSSFAAPAAALLLVGIGSLFVSEHLRESARVLRTVIVEPVVFYYLVTTSVKGRPHLWWLVGAMVAAGVAVSLLSLYQYFFTQDVITAEGVRRVRGLYGSPNNLGLFLGRVLPLAACLGAFGRQRWRWGLAVAPLFASVALTYSWGAWFGLAAAAVFVGAVRGRRTLGMVLAGILLLGIGLLAFAGVERLESHLGWGQEAGTSFLRLQLWEASWNMLRAHPLLGVGLDNFLYQYRETYVLPGAIVDLDLSHPHNIVLDFWLSLGLAGVAVAAWLLWIFFSTARRIYCSVPDRRDQALALGLMASMVGFVAHGLVDNSYFVPDLAVVFWLSLGLVAVMDRSKGGL